MPWVLVVLLLNPSPDVYCRYRNMCRFNSGVSPWRAPRELRTHWRYTAVLLPSRTAAEVQVLLENRVRVARSPTSPYWTRADQMLLSSAILITIRSCLWKTTKRSTVCNSRRARSVQYWLCISGFTIALPEYPETIATLWDTVKGAFHLPSSL